MVSPKSAFTLVFSEDQKEILLVKRRDNPVWEFPGGKIEPGEGRKEAALREAQEETGYQIKINRSVGRFLSRFSLLHSYMVFEGSVIGGERQVNEEAKDIQFFHLDKLPKNLSPFTSLAIDIWKGERMPKAIPMSPTIFFRFLYFAITHPQIFFRFILARCGIHINS